MKKPRARKDHIPEEKLKIIFRKTIKVGDCLEWTGNFFRKSGKLTYPYLYYKSKVWRGNRLVMSLLHGGLPKNKLVLHKCDNAKCLNPDHLYFGTWKDNAQDTVRRNRNHESRKTHCTFGHPYNGKNLRRDRRGKRYCKSCFWYYNRHMSPKKEMPECLR